jgi:hypothetical protein
MNNNTVAKIVEPKGMNFVVRKAIDSQIKQLKQLEPILGRPALKKQIDITPLEQEYKDYVYARMGWL